MADAPTDAPTTDEAELDAQDKGTPKPFLTDDPESLCDRDELRE